MKPPNEQSIFLRAREFADVEQRASFLDSACQGDTGLRLRVEQLLSFDETDDGIVDAMVADEAQYRIETVGGRIGPYKLLDVVGEGGMGTVFMAEQRSPIKRRVALKVIKAGMDTAQVIARFEAERQALSMMDHPNIAKVLDAGTTPHGRPYFVMELINGVPLTEYCDRLRLSVEDRLRLFTPICDAVQHAHSKGVIHRDLKPSNVLIALYDGTPSPKVIDFGVAKATQQTLTEKTLFTRLGQVVGTFEYMSPEQAQRNQLDIDTRSDVYSLGSILYELLTGTPPFAARELRSAGLDEVLRIIRDVEPPRPSLRLSTNEGLPTVASNRRLEPKRLSTFVKGDLDWICMKALEKDRGRRYGTAERLGNDVCRFLQHQAIEARPPSAMYRFQKLVRRNRIAFAVAFVTLILLTAGIAGTVSQWQRAKKSDARSRAAQKKAEKAEGQANKARDRAFAAASQLRESLIRSHAFHLINESERVREQAPIRSLLLGIAAVEATRVGNNDIPTNASITLREAYRQVGGRALVNRQVSAPAISLVPGRESCIVGWSDGSVWETPLQPAVIDRDSTRLILEKHDAPVLALALSPDGETVASYAQDGSLHVLNTPTKRTTKIHFNKNPSVWGKSGIDRPLAISADGQWLACSASENTVMLWELSKSTLTKDNGLILKGHSQPITSLSFGSNGEWLITSRGNLSDGSESSNSSAMLWRLSSVESEPTGIPLAHENSGVRQAMVSSNGRWAATAGSDGAVYLWELSTAHENLLPIRLPHDAPVSAISFSFDGEKLATAAGNTVVIWSLGSQQPIAKRINGFDANVSWVGFSVDNTKLIVIRNDHRINVRSLLTEGVRDEMTSHDGPITGLAINKDVFVTSCKDGSVRVWRLDSGNSDGTALANLPGGESPIFCGDTANLFTQDGVYLRFDNRVETTGNAASALNGRLLGMDWTGQYVALTDKRPNRIRCIDLHSNKTSRLNAVGIATCAAICPGAQWIAIGGDAGETGVWKIEKGGEYSLERLSHDSAVSSLMTSPDGRWLYVKSKSAHELWDLNDVDSPRKAYELESDVTDGQAAFFSANCRWLAFGLGSNVQLLDLQDPRDVRSHSLMCPSIVSTVIINNAGSRVYVDTLDENELLVWQVPRGKGEPTLDHMQPIDEGVAEISFSSNGRWLITISEDRALRLWDLDAESIKQESKGVLVATSEMRHFAVSNDGAWLATAEEERSKSRTGIRTYLWPLGDEQLLRLATQKAGRSLTAIERRSYGIDEFERSLLGADQMLETPE